MDQREERWNIVFLLVLFICALVMTEAWKDVSFKDLYEQDVTSFVKYKEDGVAVENTEDGYIIVNVRHNGKNNKYNCYIENDGITHKIKYAYGIGDYEVTIYRKNDEGKAQLAYKEVYKGTDTKFTGSSYNVEIDKYRNTIDSLIKENSWDKDTSYKTLWEYFNEYDVESKINNEETDVFIPNLDKVVKEKKGNYFDIASLITCISRELYGEARLCVGTSCNKPHAWCEIKTEDGWLNMDTVGKDSYETECNINKYKVAQYY